MPDKLLWKLLEKLPGLQASMCEWQASLVSWSGWPAFQKNYLQLTPVEVTAVNCKTACGMGCPRQVVKYSSDDIIAVCTEQESTPYNLTFRELLVYTLNKNTLFKNIAAELNFEFQPTKLEHVQTTWKIDDHRPTAGVCHPVLISFPHDSDMLRNTVQTLCLEQTNKFMLILPTRRKLCKYVLDLLAKKEAILLILEEEFSFSENGYFQLKRANQSFFTSTSEQNCKPKSDFMVYFKTPAGITWQDIQIRFIDGHTVSIKTGHSDAGGSYNYTQMGMANSKSGDRNLQWILLQKFAESGGEISWKSRHASNALKKQKQELSLRLFSFFRLEGDPIVWDKTEKCYRCVFSIVSENW